MIGVSVYEITFDFSELVIAINNYFPFDLLLYIDWFNQMCFPFSTLFIIFFFSVYRTCIITKKVQIPTYLIY